VVILLSVSAQICFHTAWNHSEHQQSRNAMLRKLLALTYLIGNTRAQRIDCIHANDNGLRVGYVKKR
jgi:hypothetical protein